MAELVESRYLKSYTCSGFIPILIDVVTRKKLINYTQKEIHSHHYKIKKKKSYCLVLIIATLTLEKLIMVV